MPTLANSVVLVTGGEAGPSRPAESVHPQLLSIQA